MDVAHTSVNRKEGKILDLANPIEEETRIAASRKLRDPRLLPPGVVSDIHKKDEDALRAWSSVCKHYTSNTAKSYIAMRTSVRRITASSQTTSGMT